MSTLDEIIHMATLTADLNVIRAVEKGQIHTRADEARVAVNAAIRSAIDNGLLAVTSDAAERLATGVGMPDYTEPTP